MILLALAFSAIYHNALASESKQIRIISTNDIHLYLRPIYYRYADDIKPCGPQPRDGDYLAKAALEGKIGGMAHLATVVKRLRAEKPGRTLLVDAGDTWHGSALSVFDKGVSMVKIMNAIGYEVMAPGNWEFFYPKDHLLDLIDQANFPVIAYNLTDKEWGDPVLPQYVVKQVGDVKIAFVGLTYPWTGLTSAVSGAAKWFNFGIKEDEARTLIQKIRETEDPDLIVFVSHGGYGLDQKFASRVDGIDTLISGHTHDEVFDPVVWNNTLIYQGGAHAKFVTSLDIEVRDKKIVKYEYELVRVNQDQVPADPKIKALVDEAYRPHRKVLDEVVGQTDVMLYRRDYWQSPMGNMITDALREIAGTDVSLFPAWRYGATLLPGRITAEDIYNVVPTDGRIVTYSMRGKVFRQLLE
ncbi:MAG: hypothetical protein DRQ37_02265, partial [Gammaproteobacteria bacterium]